MHVSTYQLKASKKCITDEKAPSDLRENVTIVDLISEVVNPEETLVEEVLKRFP